MKVFQRRKAGSLFGRYYFQTSLSLLLCIVFSCGSMLYFFISYWRNDRLTTMKDDALSLARSVLSYIYDDSHEKQPGLGYAEAQEILSSVSRLANISCLLVDSGGKIIIKTDASKDKQITDCDYVFTKDSIPLKEALAEDNKKKGTYFGKIEELGNDRFFLAVESFEYNGNGYSIILLQSAGSAFKPYTDAFVRRFVYTLILAGLMSLFFAFITSLRIIKPVKLIADATRHYAGGDFTVKTDPNKMPAELVPIATSVNSMAEALAVTEASRSSFVANISHELKTPMTTINGFADAILDGTIAPEEQNKYISIISDESKRLSRLVIEMLNMSKIEAGKLSPTISDVNLSKMLMSVLISFEPGCREKNIEITGLDKIGNITVQADDGLINQVFYNLVDNAVKFTPPGGLINISLRTEKPDAVFSIENSGAGFSEEESSLIFDRFYKTDKSRGLNSKSFGIGLYIVKSITEIHNGVITAKSSPDGPTVFTVRLPLEHDQRRDKNEKNHQS